MKSPGALPTPRRLILTHNPETGSPILDDTSVPIIDVDGMNQGLAMIYVQSHFIAKQSEVLSGKDDRPDLGWVKSEGVSTAFIDFPPGMEGPLHFTTSFDYMVLLFGQADLVLHDGTRTTLHPGEVFINAAGVHKWINKDQTTRFLGISLPCEPQLIKGKKIEETDIKAIKFF